MKKLLPEEVEHLWKIKTPPNEQIMGGLPSSVIDCTAVSRDKIANALKASIELAGTYGRVLTLPELVALKSKDNSTPVHKDWYAGYSEECIGVDVEGRHYPANTFVMMVIHGGGMHTPEYIERALKLRLTDGSAMVTTDRFDSLLQGRIPGGDSINLLTLDEVKKSGSMPYHRYAIMFPYDAIEKSKSGRLSLSEFVEHPLVIARAGGQDNLEKYWSNTVAHSGQDYVGCWRWEENVGTQGLGRILCMNYHSGSLDSVGLDRGATYLVVPEVGK